MPCLKPFSRIPLGYIIQTGRYGSAVHPPRFVKVRAAPVSATSRIDAWQRSWDGNGLVTFPHRTDAPPQVCLIGMRSSVSSGAYICLQQLLQEYAMIVVYAIQLLLQQLFHCCRIRGRMELATTTMKLSVLYLRTNVHTHYQTPCQESNPHRQSWCWQCRKTAVKRQSDGGFFVMKNLLPLCNQRLP